MAAGPLGAPCRSRGPRRAAPTCPPDRWLRTACRRRARTPRCRRWGRVGFVRAPWAARREPRRLRREVRPKRAAWSCRGRRPLRPVGRLPRRRGAITTSHDVYPFLRQFRYVMRRMAVRGAPPHLREVGYTAAYDAARDRAVAHRRQASAQRRPRLRALPHPQRRLRAHRHRSRRPTHRQLHGRIHRQRRPTHLRRRSRARLAAEPGTAALRRIALVGAGRRPVLRLRRFVDRVGRSRPRAEPAVRAGARRRRRSHLHADVCRELLLHRRPVRRRGRGPAR